MVSSTSTAAHSGTEERETDVPAQSHEEAVEEEEAQHGCAGGPVEPGDVQRPYVEQPAGEERREGGRAGPPHGECEAGCRLSHTVYQGGGCLAIWGSTCLGGGGGWDSVQADEPNFFENGHVLIF